MRVVLENKSIVEDASQVASILDLISDLLCDCPRGSDLTLSSSGITGLAHVLLLSSSTIEDLVEKVPNATTGELLAKVAELSEEKERGMSDLERQGAAIGRIVEQALGGKRKSAA
ncbi:MAG: hypothetical protein ABSC04_01665 [Syntrophobacteraceae bacterium]